MRRLLLLITLFLPLALPATAQDFGRAENIESTSGTYFKHLLRGQASIQVSAVGALRQPGLYELGSNADLRQLLVLAGGPELAPQNARNSRTVNVQLLRMGLPTPVFEADLATAMAGRGASMPLREGDVLIVEVIERERFNWRDAFTVLGGLSAVAFMIQVIATTSN